MNRRIISVAAIVAVAIAVVLGGAGVAYAYWSASGTGSASGLTGNTVAITVSPATPTASLYPGSTSNVVMTATNTNATSVKVTTFTLDTTQGTGGFAVDSAHASAGCTLGSLSFTTATNGGAGWTVPGKVGSVNGTLSITLSNALAMTTAAANACQGATFTVFLVAS